MTARYRPLGDAAGEGSGREAAGAGVQRALDLGVVVALLGLSLWLRWPALDPSSLWLDDAWVALVHRTSGVDELRFVGFAAPGFAAMLKGWFALVGYSELAAQVPALVAGVVAPVVAYLIARWRGWHRAGAVLGAVALAVGPIAVTYATRVKQYTTEGLLGLVLLALALWLLDDRTDHRRWATFVLVGAVGTVVSAFLAPTVAAGLAAVLVAGLRAGDRRTVQRAVAWGLLYGVGALAWYAVVLAPAVTSSISGFWADDFLDLGDGFPVFISSLLGAGREVAAGALPLPGAVGLLLVALGVLAVVVGRGPEPRPELLVLLLTPAVMAVVLAMLQLAPLGGGRTDLFLYPSLSLLLAAGADAGIRLAARHAKPSAAAASLAAVAIVAALLVAAEPVGPYPRSDVGPLVSQMEASAGPEDALLIYPATMWAYALYTEGDISLEPEARSAWGFAPRFVDERVRVLPPGREDPDAYLPTVEALHDEREEVVWLLVSHWREDLERLREQLEAVGFTGRDIAVRDGARLERFERDLP